MGLVGSLRTLWRFRLAAIAVALVAIALGVSVAYRYSPPGSLVSKRYQVAVGTATALVDSPSSQVVDLGRADVVGVDISSLSSRATLLVSVLTSSPLKDEIAARAGVPPEKLIAVSPAVAGAGGASAKAPAVPKGANVYVLNATVPMLETGVVPMVSVQTQAPDAKQASRLANAAIEVLQKHLTTVAASDRVPAERRLVVRQLGPARAQLQTRGPGKTIAAAVALLIFGLGCAAIIGVVALAGGWRAASELERVGPDDFDFAINGHEFEEHIVSPIPAPQPQQHAVNGSHSGEPEDLDAEDLGDDASQTRNWASR